MRYFSYNEPTEDGNGVKTVVMSEEQIRDVYWPYWYGKMCAKYGKEKVDQDYSFADCLDDWIAVNWAWEITPLESSEQKLREGMREAFKIIEVLYMDALDNHKESWPRANDWMTKWAEFKEKTEGNC